MKKSLIALAVAGAMTAPMIAQADATVYGSLRVAVVDNDNGTDMIDNTSRIGVKATSELENGMKATAHFENYANTVNGTFGTPAKGRLAYIALAGDFGKLTTGRQWTPQWLTTTAKVDILDAPTSEFAHSYGTGGRQGNMIAYTAPAMSGLSVTASTIIRGGSNSVDNAANANGKDIDAYGLSANYAMGGIEVGASILSYRSSQAAFDGDITAVAASYSADAVYVGAVFESDDLRDNDTVQVAGSYSMDKTKVLASFVDVDAGSTLGFEVQQTLGKAARAFANYTLDDDGIIGGDTLSFGYRVSF